MTFWGAGLVMLGVAVLAVVYYVVLDHILWLRRQKRKP